MKTVFSIYHMVEIIFGRNWPAPLRTLGEVSPKQAHFGLNNSLIITLTPFSLSLLIKKWERLEIRLLQKWVKLSNDISRKNVLIWTQLQSFQLWMKREEKKLLLGFKISEIYNFRGLLFWTLTILKAHSRFISLSVFYFHYQDLPFSRLVVSKTHSYHYHGLQFWWLTVFRVYNSKRLPIIITRVCNFQGSQFSGLTVFRVYSSKWLTFSEGHNNY